jgi:hypothetical protein
LMIGIELLGRHEGRRSTISSRHTVSSTAPVIAPRSPLGLMKAQLQEAGA